MTNQKLSLPLLISFFLSGIVASQHSTTQPSTRTSKKRPIRMIIKAVRAEAEEKTELPKNTFNIKEKDPKETARVFILAMEVMKHLDKKCRANPNSQELQLRRNYYAAQAGKLMARLQASAPLQYLPVLAQDYGDYYYLAKKNFSQAAVMYYLAVASCNASPAAETSLKTCYKSMLANYRNGTGTSKDFVIPNVYILAPGAKTISEKDVQSWRAMVDLLGRKEKFWESQNDSVQYALGILNAHILQKMGQRFPPAAMAMMTVQGISRESMERLLKTFQKDTFIGLVQITFSTSEGISVAHDKAGKQIPGSGRKMHAIDSGWVCDLTTTTNPALGKSYFRIKGHFKLLKLLAGQNPPMGPVDEEIEDMPSQTIYSFRRPKNLGVEFKHRLSALSDALKKNVLRIMLELPRLYRFSFLVIGPKNPKESVLRGTFIGPFADNELEYIAQAVQWIEKLPENILNDDIRKTLSSPNPAMVMLALIKLRESNSHNPDDYAKAIVSVPKEYIKEFVVGVLSEHSKDHIFQKNVGVSLRDRLGILSPSRRDEILQVIHSMRKRHESSGFNAMTKPLKTF